MQQEAQEILEQAIKQLYADIDKASLNYLLGQSNLQYYESNQIIIRAHKIQESIFFLTNGLVRAYYNDAKGNEITIRFINNSGWATHYSAFISKAPSKYTFQALEPCTALSIPFKAIQEGYLKHQGLERFGRLVAESVLRTQQARIESFQFLDAEARYLEFVQTYPALFNRVSLSHLSSYLGIQRQSLSRIRKKIAKQ